MGHYCARPYIIGFGGQATFVTATHYCCCHAKAATDNVLVTEHDCAPIKLLTKLGSGLDVEHGP